MPILSPLLREPTSKRHYHSCFPRRAISDRYRRRGHRRAFGNDSRLLYREGKPIGIGSTTLDGARIGKNSLIAAGSLVTPDTQIPEQSFVLGSPTRVKRELSDEEIENLQNVGKIMLN